LKHSQTGYTVASNPANRFKKCAVAIPFTDRLLPATERLETETTEDAPSMEPVYAWYYLCCILDTSTTTVSTDI
jgi:hypothetical protein